MNGLMSSFIELSLYELTHIRDVLISIKEGELADDVAGDINDALDIIDSVMKSHNRG